tara:strand:- start:292 stop:459 length:168 start_codon:yes stop_codon:yes gene_type:complete
MDPSYCKADDEDSMDHSFQLYGSRVISILVAAVAVSLKVQRFIQEPAGGFIKIGA